MWNGNIQQQEGWVSILYVPAYLAYNKAEYVYDDKVRSYQLTALVNV